jgi:flavin-dependent dehydrogenase
MRPTADAVDRIAVIGAGPAGGYLARALALAGLEVDIYDHSHPREKPCGGVITTEALHYLPEVTELRSANRLTDLALRTPFGHCFQQRQDHPSLAVDRRELDGSLLAGAIRAGAVHHAERVLAVTVEEGHPRLRSRSGERRYDLVVGADGVRSLVARAVGLAPDPHQLGHMEGGWGPPIGPRGTLVLHFGDLLGYAWVINRAEQSSVGIGGRLVDRTGLHRQFQAFLEHRGIQASSLRPYRWTIPFSNDVFSLNQPRCGPGWLLVGDAAGFCDPLTGQGIHLAVASAWAAATAILAGRPLSYESRWRDLFGANLYFGVRHRDLLGSKPMTEQMLRSLERNPGLGPNFFKLV